MGAWDVGGRPLWDHKLAHNKREWSPQRLYFLDTETGEEKSPYGSWLPLRSWELCVVWRDKPTTNKNYERWFSGETGLELCKLLDELITTDKTSWLWAHNLGFDLSTTRLVTHMPRMGWQWTVGAVASDSPWMRWKKGNKSLTAVDSLSHLPKALRDLGAELGLPKLTMPEFDAPPEEWDTYRHRDVEILKRAVLQYLEWWDANKLGNLSVSGPASGWNCWRHTTDKLRVHVDPDPDQRAWGRAAIYGGRRSSWRVGELGKGPWVELDIQRAHLSICRNLKTPIAVYGWVNELSPDHPLIGSERAGVVADCTIRTDEDRYPLLTRAGVLFPVGEFTTRLAGPELADAQRRGHLVSVGRGLAVALGKPMAQWAGWVESGLADGGVDLPPMARVAMKGWSRTVIGKWAGRTSREVMRYPWPDDGWRIEPGFFNTPSVPATTVYGCGEARTYLRDQESYDSFPAAYAWITSHMRVALNRLIDLVGTEHLAMCNTDAVVVHVDALRQWAPPNCTTDRDIAREAAKMLSNELQPFRVTVKHIADTMRIKTPEHLVFGAGESVARKVASVSRHATETSPWVFEGDTWPGLAKQLTIDPREGFHLVHREVDVSGAKPLAWYTTAGVVHPPHFTIDAEGNNVLSEPFLWDEQPWLPIRRTDQHPEVLGLLSA